MFHRRLVAAGLLIVLLAGTASPRAAVGGSS
jgi:hypothetical protein